MLVEFRVKNFLSFKEEVVFSMLTSGKKEHPENLIPFDEEKSEYLTKTAMIYGPNASGKTNLLKAINFLCSGVLRSKNLSTSGKIDITPFLFDEEAPKQPSFFEIKFIQNNIMYIYGVEISPEKIYREYLYKTHEKRYSAKPVKVFERTDDDEANSNPTNKIKQKYLRESAHNRLYLSVAGFWQSPDVLEAYKWFEDNVRIFIPDFVYKEPFNGYTKRRLMKNPDYGNKIIDLFSSLDTGISSLGLLKVDIEEIKFPEDMSAEIRAKFKEQMEEDSSILMTKHKIQGKEYSLPFQYESLGTQNALDLVGILVDLIGKQGVLVMDELESSLHPELVRELLKQVQKSGCNVQLIFTTHNTNLMDLSIFRRDQYWFTSKDPELQCSELFSLADIQGVRNDENIQKKYLMGRYGAFPYIKEFDKLLCQ